MLNRSFFVSLNLAIVALMMNVAVAEPLALDASATPASPKTGGFKLGTARNPAGHEITVNSFSLLRDGKPWLPVMGEFHFARYPAAEWRDELLKMKAGGIDIVATYVFWIHHEEIKDQWDWSGQRSLRNFIKTCQDVGMPVIVRAGPWCHGEVRNGGVPDYITEMGKRARTDDPEYLARARILYTQIAEQLKGLLWKDGGPVVGMQFENEYSGPATHLMTLKKIALELGMDLPIYTKTGWPITRQQVPFGEMLPLEGAYAEGFWDRELTSMPGKYPREFLFSPLRTNATVGTDVLGNREAQDAANANEYPYLTCELGGGMMSSYHRRILMYPTDIVSIAMVRIGSGSNLPGYYMYHGGTNPEGKRSTLMESQATNMWNDLPVKTYDFQAPIGEFGQLRPHYHELRRLHMFLHDFGTELTQMRPSRPEKVPTNEKDTTTLRWVVRSNGDSGYVFVNNYQRLQPMPAKENVQFDLKLPGGSLRLPAQPVTVPANSYFVWPFNLDLGGIKLIYATAQPVCSIEDDGTKYFFFAQAGDVPAHFAFDAKSAALESATGQSATAEGRISVSQTKPGLETAIRLKTLDGRKVGIVLLDPANSLACWKGALGGKDRVLISRAGLIFDGGKLRICSSDPSEMKVQMFESGAFKSLTVPPIQPMTFTPTLEVVKQAGPAREIKNGNLRVPEAPSDAEFEQAAMWRVKLPPSIDPSRNMILRIHYTGDVARICMEGQLIDDNFYNGREFDLGLKRYGSEVYERELILKILPLRKDSPIYMASEARPDFGAADSVARIDKIELLEQYEQTVEIR